MSECIFAHFFSFLAFFLMDENKGFVTYERFIPFSFFVNDEKQKNQLYCLCLKMTADFGNFVAKNDKKRKTKDEMNPAYVYKQT